MRKRTILLVVISCMLSIGSWAQNKVFSGQVLSTDGSPIQGAIITPSNGMPSVVSDKDGVYLLTTLPDKGFLKVVAEGYYDLEYRVAKSLLPKTITLIPISSVKYNGLVRFPEFSQNRENKSVSTQAVEKKDMKKGFTIDLAIQDELPGLQVIRKGGMTGEGSFLNLRGTHTFVAESNPLVVVNGIPYLGDQKTSNTINGYSRNNLFGFNKEDVRNVTLLKGADAAQYGSLGSNGVLLIETEQATSDNLETRISFNSQFGISLPGKTVPVMNPTEYKTYLQDIGMTRYELISTLRSDYPFLENSENYNSYLFNNNTNWIGQVQGPSFVTDNVFRVEGGDEIAKYNISFGYTSEGGVLGNTNTDSYHTLINSNIMVNRKVDIFTNVGLYYVNSKLQEQGRESATNALTSAYWAMPVLSPYLKEANGNVLSNYATYDGWNVNENPRYPYDNVSNALAIVNTVKASDKVYDANIRFGLNYRMNRYLTITGLMNLYYNYTEESIFIPGVTNQAIVPQYYSTGLNTVRMGVTENKTNFYGLNALYERTFNERHQLRANGGVRYIGRSLEYDFARGYNTANDFYETLGSVTDDKDISGNINEWKSLSYFLHTDYIFDHLLKTTVNMTLDGTSVSGMHTNRFGLFPSLSLTYMAANTGDLPEAINLLNFTAEVSRTGNSRFSSNYGKNYYRNSNFFNLGTITRSSVPNTKLQWEKKDQLDLGFDLSMVENKINMQLNWFSARSYDLLVAREISSVYGSADYYDNVGEIATNGFEFSLRLNPIHTKSVDWMISASVSKASSIIKSLGNSNELISTFKSYGEDDVEIMSRVGESPYQFYGLRTDGIFNTTAEAEAAGLSNVYGKPYHAGDIRFVNTNDDDHVINAKDKQLLGDAAPDWFGALNTSFRYNQLTLLAQFGYSIGNVAFNAVRRDLESMNTFHNQATSVLNRWQMEGQETSTPRAVYGDPSGNNLFSDRWLEDASYLKLRSLTLSYQFKNNWFNLFRSGTVYVVGENLFTFTKYLGGDPEFSYSNDAIMQGFDYAKVTMPRTFKLGFSLNF